MKTKYSVIGLGILFLTTVSCNKEWLDVKPDSHLSVLSSLSEFQTLMDNTTVNIGNTISEVGTDNYYISGDLLPGVDIGWLNEYLWAENGYGYPSEPRWQNAYSAIYICNTALDGINKISKNADNLTLWNTIYGEALFYRAFQYYGLTQTFTKSYDSVNAGSDLGLPMPANPDITAKNDRVSLQQTYSVLLSDLLTATNMLPIKQSYKNRPVKAAGYALLSRIYLSVGDYSDAFLYADSVLQSDNILLDYNTVPITNGNITMPAFPDNPEVIFTASITGTGSPLHINYARMDTLLYAQYADGDLRKALYFRSRGVNQYSFSGSYTSNGGSSNSFFSAPGVDEMYLTRAECYARMGNTDAAMSDLNTLLIKRWKSDSFTPFTAAGPNDALAQILSERRKELLMRGVRWSDLRRLNKDNQFMTTISRIYNGQTYILPPGDPKYVWPIPDEEIQYGGIQQNPR